MKTQIILIALFSISFAAVTSSNQCACEEITQQTDCTGGCAWVTVGSDSSCQAGTVTQDCKATTDETACNNISTCTYKSGACTTFSACSDVTTTAAGVCRQKSKMCTDGTIGSACVDVKCANLTADTCSGARESATMRCNLTGTTCAAVDVSKCSVVVDQAICEKMPCKWNSGKCQAYTCADSQSKEDCDFVQSDDFSSITLCTFGTACADAADTSAYTAATCKTQTGNYFAWDGSACSACEGSSSHSYLLAFIGILAMLLI